MKELPKIMKIQLIIIFILLLNLPAFSNSRNPRRSRNRSNYSYYQRGSWYNTGDSSKRRRSYTSNMVRRQVYSNRRIKPLRERFFNQKSTRSTRSSNRYSFRRNRRTRAMLGNTNNLRFNKKIKPLRSEFYIQYRQTMRQALNKR